MELNNETINNQGQENTGTEQNESTENKTYSQAEVDALIQKETDRRVSQALATAERKNQAKLREAEKLANMSATEKYEFELQKREQAIAEKEHQLLLAENRAEASKILAEKGLSQTFLDFVLADTADVMNDNITKIERAFKASVKQEVEKRLGNNAPKSSSINNGTMTKEQFSKLSLAEKQKLYQTDKELYNSFYN